MRGRYLKKLEKLAIHFDQKDYKPNKNTRHFDEVDLILQEETIKEPRLVECEENLHQATRAFSRALDELNTINAQLNRGPVDIEDELYHHCFSQETLNERYADTNVRYNARLAYRLRNIQDTAETDKQMWLHRLRHE